MTEMPTHEIQSPVSTHSLPRKVGDLLLTYGRYYASPGILARLPEFLAMRNRHAGKRCFIIGNGPSLRRTDLSKLQGEFTIGLNRIYLLFDELGFETTWLVSVNQLVLEQCADELASLSLPKFLSWGGYHHFPQEKRREVFWLNTFYRQAFPRFGKFPPGPTGLWEGATVTYVALQLAYFFGFDQVILVGVDHSFSTKGDPHKEVVTDQDGDPNHFSSNYFGPGFRWHLPDLQTSELAYALARYHYGLSNRLVLDATVGGKLTIFPKVDYDSLF